MIFKEKSEYSYPLIIVAIVALVAIISMFLLISPSPGDNLPRDDISGKAVEAGFASIEPEMALDGLTSSSQQAPTESPATVQGKINVVYTDDFDNGKLYKEYYIITADGEQLRLQIDDLPEGSAASLELGAGLDEVTVSGRYSGGSLSVSSIGNIATKPGIIMQEQTMMPSNQNMGMAQRRILAILVDFSDLPQLMTVEETREIIFGNSFSAKKYFEEVSGGRFTLSGDVVGVYRLDGPGSGCADTKWIRDAMKIAQEKGIDVNSYDHVMVMWTKEGSGCSYGGRAGIWMNGKSHMAIALSNQALKKDVSLFAHELGHTFGILSHANSMTSTLAGKPAVLAYPFNNIEYGDHYDVMGYNPFSTLTVPHLNGYYKYVIGSRLNVPFITSNNIVRINSSRAGVYKIYPAENPGENVSVILIYSDYISADYPALELEYRTNTGFDNFGNEDSITKGISIRYIGEDETYLLDSTPQTPEMTDAALLPGQRLNLTHIGIVLQVLPKVQGQQFMAVNISFVRSPCMQDPTFYMGDPTISNYLFDPQNPARVENTYRVLKTGRTEAGCFPPGTIVTVDIPEGFKAEKKVFLPIYEIHTVYYETQMPPGKYPIEIKATAITNSSQQYVSRRTFLIAPLDRVTTTGIRSTYEVGTKNVTVAKLIIHPKDTATIKSIGLQYYGTGAQWTNFKVRSPGTGQELQGHINTTHTVMYDNVRIFLAQDLIVYPDKYYYIDIIADSPNSNGSYNFYITDTQDTLAYFTSIQTQNIALKNRVGEVCMVGKDCYLGLCVANICSSVCVNGKVCNNGYFEYEKGLCTYSTQSKQNICDKEAAAYAYIPELEKKIYTDDCTYASRNLPRNTPCDRDSLSAGFKQNGVCNGYGKCVAQIIQVKDLKTPSIES